MTLIEDRLRAATRAAAATVAPDTAPPLRLPATAQAGTSARRPARRRRGWLIPAGAAASVAVMLGAAAAVQTVAGGKPAPARAQHPAVVAYPAAGNGLPSLFISPITAKIISTVTGKVVARPPLPGVARQVAAGADGRTFYAAVTAPCPHIPGRSVGGPYSHLIRSIACPQSMAGPATFYRISVGSGGVQVNKLPIAPVAAGLETISPSPDGSRLAIAVLTQVGDLGLTRTLTVASTTTGAARTWTTSRAGSIAGRVSWLADGHTLAFNWSSGGPTAPGSALRLLDTSAPGSNLLSGQSVLALSNSAGAFKHLMISPDGGAVFGSIAHGVNAVNGKGGTGMVGGRSIPLGSVVEFYTRSGRPAEVLVTAGPHGNHSYAECDPVWTAPSGRRVLITCVATPSGSSASSISIFVAGPGGSLRPLTWSHTLAPWTTIVPGDIGGTGISALAAGL